jgi:hypothetical protein
MAGFQTSTEDGDAGRGVALEFHPDTLLEYAQQTKHFGLVPLRYDPVRLMDVLDFTCELALFHFK